MILTPSIKAVVFDLGNVIIDLAEDKTVQSFAQIANMPVDRVRALYLEHEAFIQYEIGKLDDAGFRGAIREILSADVSDAAIDAAWSAMLHTLPVAKVHLLKSLRKDYHVFILSNTNGIHIDYVNRMMIPLTGFSGMLDDFVHKAYYSHRVGARKPDREIYRQLLDENNLLPEQVVFLDDKPANVETAVGLGIHGIVVKQPSMVLDLFGKHEADT